MIHYTNTNNPVDFPGSKKDKIEDFYNKYASYIGGMTDEEWDNLGKSYLKHTKGNLLDLAEAGEFDIVVQGCNCFNTMGGGIAREIRERYPVVASVDMETVKGDYNKLGTWTECDAGETNRFTIINAYTQYDMSKGTDVFEYTAFELILQKLCHAYGDRRIGLPYIGMGLAGGDKEVILEQIEHFAHKVAAKSGTVTLVEFG
jgi:O-acetyl-ADP-ribose deacetylase (regulator of RNase III)